MLGGVNGRPWLQITCEGLDALYSGFLTNSRPSCVYVRLGNADILHRRAGWRSVAEGAHEYGGRLHSLHIISVLHFAKCHWPMHASHWPIDNFHWPIASSHWPIDASHWRLDCSHWPVDSSHWPIVSSPALVVRGNATWRTAPQPARVTLLGCMIVGWSNGTASATGTMCIELRSACNALYTPAHRLNIVACTLHKRCMHAELLKTTKRAQMPVSQVLELCSRDAWHVRRLARKFD